MMNILYREAVGALMWASTMTRPDIANAFRNVARYRENSWGQHWTAVMKMFEYLRNKPERGLTCGRGNLKMTVAAYTDADYATDLDARCSLSWEVMLRGAAISWFSRMQKVKSTRIQVVFRKFLENHTTDIQGKMSFFLRVVYATSV